MLIYLHNWNNIITFAADKQIKEKLIMDGLKDFKSNIKGKSFYIFDLSNVPYTMEQLLNGLEPFNKFMHKLNISVKELLELISYLGITDKELFDYTTIKTDFLVGKDAVYTEKIAKFVLDYKMVKTYHDVYVKTNSYVSLRFSDIACELMLRHFPFLGKEPFIRDEKRFKDNIDKLPVSINTKVKEIDTLMLIDNDITIGDLIKLYTDPSYKDSVIKKPIWKIYSDVDYIYFRIDENKGGHTVFIKLDDFFNKNWKAVEEQNVFGVCLYDENDNLIKGKWFKGKQKDAPYFKGEIVDALKKFMTNK